MATLCQLNLRVLNSCLLLQHRCGVHIPLCEMRPVLMPCCSWAEWRMVLLLSAPVVLLDEALKLVTRR